ncbi:MAG: hypothetical protein Q8L13_10410 [Bradyrhizobium sp.]|uniref:hypothetical protein n=1 Tax=Bradyrhizobium sp. TaxID=376 RepID=UPI00272F880E|nr:hypothetical protein [Bradyrhizobium sp.]MDP1866740.1 hypothetical protein [Bradyrhizobium sp.]
MAESAVDCRIAGGAVRREAGLRIGKPPRLRNARDMAMMTMMPVMVPGMMAKLMRVSVSPSAIFRLC